MLVYYQFNTFSPLYHHFLPNIYYNNMTARLTTEQD